MAPDDRVGTLLLTLTDSSGKALDSKLRLHLEHDGAAIYDGTLELTGELEIAALPHGRLRVYAAPEGFQPLSREVLIGPVVTSVLMRFDVDSAKVVDIDAPSFTGLDRRLREMLQKSAIRVGNDPEMFTGEKFYGHLDAYSKATLLNTFTKACATELTLGGTVWDQFKQIHAIDARSVIVECSPNIFEMGERTALSPDTWTLLGGRKWTPSLLRRTQSAVFRTAEPAGSLDIEMFQAPKSPVFASAKVIGGVGRADSPFAVRDILVGTQRLSLDYRPVIKVREADPPHGISRQIVVHTRPSAGQRAIVGGSAHVTGTVARLMRDKGFGFIRVDEGVEHFFHLGSVRSDDFEALREGELVEFSVQESAKGPRAGDVRLVHPVEKKEDQDSTRETRLFANHGIVDAAGEKCAMDDVLHPGQVYFYWFHIGVAIKESAAAEIFRQPAELSGSAASVQIQVHCALLQHGFVARNVKYEPHVGLQLQSFPLSTVPGTHPLRVEVIHNGRPVYSKTWQLAVRAYSSDELDQGSQSLDEAPVAHIPAAGAQGATYRLVVDAKHRRHVELEVPSQQPFRGADAPEREVLVQLAGKARLELSTFARTVSPDEKARVDWPLAWAFLRKMAQWGAKSAAQILGTRDEQPKFFGALDTLPRGSFLHIDSDPGSFPWEWLYLQEIPPLAAPELGSKELRAILEGFLGYRFLCDVLPVADRDRINIRYVLPNAQKTCILNAINVPASPTNFAFVQGMLSWDKVHARVCDSKADMVKELLEITASAAEELHLLNVYCHHSPGAQLNQYGYHNFGDSTLYMKGKNGDPITKDYLEDDSGIKPFSGCAPLVLLNACGTAQGGDYYPSGFMPYFTNTLKVPAVIGTVAEIHTLAAYQFARDFVPQWLARGSALDTIADIRRRWLLELGNPYAMYYTVYGSGHVRLETPRPVNVP